MSFVRPHTWRAGVRALGAALGAAALVGCQAGYLTTAAVHQLRIQCAAQPIQRLLDERDVAPEVLAKLELASAARSFALQIGLTPGRSYTRFSDIGKEPLAWIVVGSKRDAFHLHSWWFPIVGQVPYKGFFKKSEAEGEARLLESQGYETWVRGTDAFSTLGWFADPVLSTMLQRDLAEIANTIIHESLHSTVWIPDHVSFNESLANFVGTVGARAFFAQRAADCRATAGDCAEAERWRDESAQRYERTLLFADRVTELYQELESLYASKRSSEEKIAERELVFAKTIAPFRAAYPRATILQKLNNAEIIQHRLYLTDLPAFVALWRDVGESWAPFLQAIREIGEQARAAKESPFASLKRRVKMK